MNKFDEAMKKIEPEADNFGEVKYDLSAAISLKRIADALEKLAAVSPIKTEEWEKWNG